MNVSKPGCFGLLATGDVDVVQRLQVVGQELDGRDDTSRWPAAASSGSTSSMSGLSHSSGVWPALW